MNKLLQTTLISVVLSTGAMASESTGLIFLEPSPTGALPRTIESGATVTVRENISIAQEIHNNGTIIIDNSLKSDTAAITISRDDGWSTESNAVIDNSPHLELESILEESKDKVLTNNPIEFEHTGFTIQKEDGTLVPITLYTPGQDKTAPYSPSKVYIIKQETEGKVVDKDGSNLIQGIGSADLSKLNLLNVEFSSSNDPILYTDSSFIDPESEETLNHGSILFLAKTDDSVQGDTITIRGHQENLKQHIYCHFGNKEAGDADLYNLNIQNKVMMNGSVLNYNGVVTLSDDLDEDGNVIESGVDGIHPELGFAYSASVIPASMSINVPNPKGILVFTTTGGEIHAPVTSKGLVKFERNSSGSKIYGNIQTNSIIFDTSVTLCSGANLTIGGVQ